MRDETFYGQNQRLLFIFQLKEEPCAVCEMYLCLHKGCLYALTIFVKTGTEKKHIFAC